MLPCRPPPKLHSIVDDSPFQILTVNILGTEHCRSLSLVPGSSSLYTSKTSIHHAVRNQAAANGPSSLAIPTKAARIECIFFASCILLHLVGRLLRAPSQTTSSASWRYQQPFPRLSSSLPRTIDDAIRTQNSLRYKFPPQSCPVSRSTPLPWHRTHLGTKNGPHAPP